MILPLLNDSNEIIMDNTNDKVIRILQVQGKSNSIKESR